MNLVHLLSRFIFCASLLSTSWVFSQDNIILKNGSEIQAKVLEVFPAQIKYRRQDNPDGPIYTTGTTDVLLIKYANGTKDVLNTSGNPLSNLPANPGSLGRQEAPSANMVGTPALNRLGYQSGLFSRYFTNGMGERIGNAEVRTLLADHSDAMQAFQRGKSFRRWTYATAGSAIALIGAGAVVDWQRWFWVVRR